MLNLDHMAASLGVLCDRWQGGFRHLATAWCVGQDEWVTAWSDEDPPSADAILLSPTTGASLPITQWENDGVAAAFRCAAGGVPLRLAGEDTLAKRQSLEAVAYPSTIDHPAFRLSARGLTAEQYHPYLCPWRLSGHLALYSSDEGWLTGRCYAGMAGGPVCNNEGLVVGLLLDGEASPDHPPLARFRRLH